MNPDVILLINNPSWQPPSSDDSPSVLHRYSISTPSKRWTIDGLSMEYRWTILYGKRVFHTIFFLKHLGNSSNFTYKRFFLQFFLVFSTKFHKFVGELRFLALFMYRFRLYLHRQKHLFIYDLVCTFASEITKSFNHLKLYNYGEFQ